MQNQVAVAGVSKGTEMLELYLLGEDCTVELVFQSNLLALHTNCITIMPSVIKLARRIRNVEIAFSTTPVQY